MNAKELTPAPLPSVPLPSEEVRTCIVDARSIVCEPTGEPSRALTTYGFTDVKCSSADARACDNSTTARITPASPAPGSVWPMQVLTVANTSGLVLEPASRSTAEAAPISIGSPRDVPVPCI